MGCGLERISRAENQRPGAAQARPSMHTHHYVESWSGAVNRIRSYTNYIRLNHCVTRAIYVAYVLCFKIRTDIYFKIYISTYVTGSRMGRSNIPRSENPLAIRVTKTGRIF
jgi:hypothetical protein